MKHGLKWIALGAVGVLAIAALAGCAGIAQAGGGQAIPAAQQGGVVANSISVSGYGEASGAPDVAYITFGVHVSDPDVGNAVADNNAQMERVKQALLDAGIAADDMQTVGFSVWPEDKYNPQTGTPTGDRVYHVDNSLSVKVRELGRAGAVIETALDAGANTVGGLSFSVEDTEALENEARVNAISDARAKAQQIADALGVRLGEAIVVSEGGAMPIVPVVYPEMAAADGGMGRGGAAAPPISAGQLTVSQSVQIVFSIER